jgi:hypothetical protein
MNQRPRVDFNESYDQDPTDGLDQESFEESEQPSSDVVDELYQNAEQQAEADDSDDIKMEDVEDRLEVAQCFRLLLKEQLFNTVTPASRKVEKRIRSYVKEQLAILMGVRQAPQATAEVVLPFDDTEISILKQIAARAKEMVQRNSAGAQPPTTVNKVAKAQEPAAPVQSVNKAVEAQQVQRKPVAQPAIRKTEPPQQSKPVAAPKQQVPNSRVPPQYKNDPTLKIKGSRVFVQARNSDGEPLWSYDPHEKKREPLLKDVTLPAKPNGAVQPVPIPPIIRSGNGFIDQANTVMSAHADAMIGFAGQKAEAQKVGRLLIGTLTQNIQPQQDEQE